MSESEIVPLPPTPPEKTSTTTDGQSDEELWAALRALLRRDVLRAAARALLAEAKAYNDKWRGRPTASEWDQGYVRGMESAAHSVANAIDRGHFNFGEASE